ncbi:hypothetical protein [Lactobacillus psittaci]|uniref:Uncharacterized protein n=1 Tax=Lactobacillus psittaci DSM 15354 TaxID=1122152 RepID=A0A0R1SCI1_9LACO|nr:hypothetical protein [Lactobacillus psittaci]KRL64005.1 hypothetical protein FC23_GL000253 [Lactobacillus psittaci DSM 15354]
MFKKVFALKWTYYVFSLGLIYTIVLGFFTLWAMYDHMNQATIYEKVGIFFPQIFPLFIWAADLFTYPWIRLALFGERSKFAKNTGRKVLDTYNHLVSDSQKAYENAPERIVEGTMFVEAPYSITKVGYIVHYLTTNNELKQRAKDAVINKNYVKIILYVSLAVLKFVFGNLIVYVISFILYPLMMKDNKLYYLAIQKEYIRK